MLTDTEQDGTSQVRILRPLKSSNLVLSHEIKNFLIFCHQELFLCRQSGPWAITNAVGATILMLEFVRLEHICLYISSVMLLFLY